jgi:hypothetical protein
LPRGSITSGTEKGKKRTPQQTRKDEHPTTISKQKVTDINYGLSFTDLLAKSNSKMIPFAWSASGPCPLARENGIFSSFFGGMVLVKKHFPRILKMRGFKS